MNIYLVGGAVRDQLLGIEPKERDWLVVGGNREKLLAQGFQQVGNDFPVFLHPETHEEYALARTERKSGHGYGGFDFDASESVTIEEDLKRRDLTINAIARSNSGELVDPYHGADDIKARLLRHVSPAFSEDPLRVLRVARFFSRFYHLGFRIADDTVALMKKIATSGELSYLTKERIWRETSLALQTKNPEMFFHCLYDCDALPHIMPALAAQYHQPCSEKPSISGRDYISQTIQYAIQRQLPTQALLSLALQPIVKHSPGNQLPAHDPKQNISTEALDSTLKKLCAPKEYSDFATAFCLFQRHVRQSKSLKPKAVIDLLQRLDAWRKPERFQDILAACNVVDNVMGDSVNEQYSHDIQFLQQCYQQCMTVKAKTFTEQGISGREVGDAIHHARLILIAEIKNTN